MRPRFAVEAHDVLIAGRAADAARLCASGISAWPDYATGYVVLAKAYRDLGRIDDAETMEAEILRRFGFPFVHEVTVPVGEASTSHATTTAPEPPADDRIVVHTLPTETVPPPVVLSPTETQSAVVSPQPRTASDFSLRIIDVRGTVTNDKRIIRAATVRLIPGLEFTSLRFEGVKGRSRRDIQHLGEPPPFRDFNSSPAMRVRESSRPSGPASQRSPQPQRRTSLEELAQRLEKARMPRPDEVKPLSPGLPLSSPPDVEPESRPKALVTETIARIYAQQGSFDKAIEAYTVLMQAKPERANVFQAAIDDIRRKMSS